jgi:hypothetical protein
VSDSCNSQALG